MKRPSVFNKVDLDFSKIPYFQKPQEQHKQIVEFLKKSFLTQKLEDKDIEKIAGAMKTKTFQEGDDIIRFGDIGKEYFILAEGDVQVIVYQKGVNPNDPQLESKV